MMVVHLVVQMVSLKAVKKVDRMGALLEFLRADEMDANWAAMTVEMKDIYEVDRMVVLRVGE